MRKLLSFISGVFVGGLVGATFAILFAPSTGTELQEKMRSSFIELKGEIESAAMDKKTELEEELNRLRMG